MIKRCDIHIFFFFLFIFYKKKNIFTFDVSFINKLNMKAITTLNTETIRGAYEAPKCEIIEMQQEGVLCSSDSNSGKHSPYDEDPFTW